MRPRRRTVLAAAGAGFALGIGAQTGGVLLLYTGQGLLGAAGLLLGLVLGALAAGVWGGSAPQSHALLRRRWGITLLGFLVAAIFGQLWMAEAALRQSGAGRALAVALTLAAPAYAVGALLATLRVRRGVAAAALAGSGVGVFLAAGVLIPHMDPGLIFFMGAVVVALSGLVDMRGRGAGEEEDEGMRDRVVIVTGVGGRGQVGFTVAEAFLEQGARVVVTDVSPEVEAHAEALSARGEVAGVVADLTRAEGAERVVDAARQRFGRLDVLVNLAGGLSVIKPLAETGEEEWARELDRNARTTFVMSRAALPLLRRQGGSIVNFASPAGLRAAAGLGAYSAAKAAVVALTRALALEEKEHGIRVNAVAPGMIDTEQNRRAVDDPEAVAWVGRDEVARTVLFLASDAASGISGETIHVLGEGLE